MKIRKAVIPAAGFGMRMLPITSVVPKELLPVCGKPVIQHVVEEAVSAGIEEVIIVLSEGKEDVAAYFRPNKKLEAHLLKNGRHEDLKELERIWNLAKITVVYQPEQKGLGHAVLCAEEAVGNEPFAVLLGDSIIKTDDCRSFTAMLVTAFGKFGRSVVGLNKTDRSLISRYGIFEGAEFEDGLFHAKRVIEKPKPDQTSSDLAFCARYVFGPEIFSLLRSTLAGADNEIQLTDAMDRLAQSTGLIGVRLDGERYDIGDCNGLLLANLSLTEFGCE